jgi:transcriptional regulator with XRE-family HTH domain
MKRSQREVAKRARITTSYLSLIESGRRYPSLPTLERVCKALGVPLHLVMLLAAGPGEIPGKRRKELARVAESLLHFLARPRAGKRR